MSWIKAARLDELKDKPVVFRRPPKQIALFSVDGKVYAVDNRCPHEGYPLAAGVVTADCVLTCNWHNWKFRLADGQCIVGGDNVRSYPVRHDNDDVWVDLSPPPAEETRRQVLKGLRAAFDDRDYGRVCREISRLHYNDLRPVDAVREAIAWSHDHLEYGSADTHAYAAAADWLALADSFSDFERQLVCLAEAVDHMAYDALRKPVYPYAAASATPYRDQDFLAAVEAEQTNVAEGLVARALNDGLHWPDLEKAFAVAALAHYNDFGHSLIYLPKTGALIDRFGSDVERLLLPPLVRQICYASREDLIPDFKDYPTALQALPEPRLGDGSAEPLATPFPSSLDQALKWLSRSLETHRVAVIYDSLLAALALNFVHYDTSYGAAYDRPVQHNVGWLDFTHGITFANAVRVMCSKFPELWRPALLQMACFLGRNFHYVDRDLDVKQWRVTDVAEFMETTREQLLDHGINQPIVAAHLLKTTFAVEAELGVASVGCGDAMLAGLNRFLHSPFKGKHSRRLARQAIALVSRDAS